jgi:predicted aspartyl protease
MHAFGSALGLSDCTRCDSMMSMDWRRRESLRVTDLDLRTFEALVELGRGTRVDGRPMLALSGDALPAVGAHTREGVLADLPFINTGRGGSIVVDVAARGNRSFPVTVDTGAVDTFLTTDYARALGISVRSAKPDAYQRDTAMGRPLRFWVTGQAVVGSGHGPTHFNYALLGGEFMRHFVVEFDFSARRLRFLDPEVHSVGDRDGEIVVPLEIRELRPYARVELGTGAVWALVDTGAESTIATTEEKARELEIAIDHSAPRTSHVNVLGTSVSTVQPLARGRLGPLELRDFDLEVALGGESMVRIQRWLQDQTLIGIYLLENYRTRFDYANRRLGLTPIEK